MKNLPKTEHEKLIVVVNLFTSTLLAISGEVVRLQKEASTIIM